MASEPRRHAIHYGTHTETTCPFWRYDSGGRCLEAGIPCHYGVGEGMVPEDCPLPIKVSVVNLEDQTCDG